MTKSKKEVKDEISEGSLMYDELFKYFVKSAKYNWYTILLLSGILNLDSEVVKEKLVYLDTELTGNPNLTKKRGDTVFEIGKYVVNIEMNQFKTDNYLEDKLRYVHYLYDKNFTEKDGKRGKKVKKMNKYIVQVHINNFDCCEKEVDYIYLKNQQGSKATPKIKIVIYNLVKLEKKYYNNFTLSKLEKLLLLLKLSVDLEELKKFIGEDEFMSKLEKEKKFFEDLMEGFYKEFDYDKELEQKRIAEVRTAHADGLEEGKNWGLKEGISQGQYKEKRNVVNNMIKMAYPKEAILKVAGINAEEYDKLITT